MSGDHNMYCSANNPKNEWIKLPTLVSVCNAQTDGWEIEFRTLYGGWQQWGTSSWHESNIYRGRPRQPKMKTVKMLAYLLNGQLVWYQDNAGCPEGNRFWIRVPAEDKTIEIPDS